MLARMFVATGQPERAVEPLAQARKLLGRRPDVVTRTRFHDGRHAAITTQAAPISRLLRIASEVGEKWNDRSVLHAEVR